MAFLAPTKRSQEDEESSGGPIAALLIAIPLSFLLWGAAALILLNLVH